MDNPTRSVILALLVSGIVFVVAGPSAYDRAGKVGAILKGTSTPTSGSPNVNTRIVFGWAVLTLFLIVGSELPGLGDLSAAFAWLILLGVLFTEGPAAFSTITALVAIPGGPGSPKKV